MKPRFELYASLTDSIPVSVNELYTTFRGRTVLKKAGEKFKSDLTRVVASACAGENWLEVVQAVYHEKAWVRLVVVYTSLQWLNASWKPGAITRGGTSQSPYQKKDVSNYMKVIEDAVAEGTGIDDSAHFEATIHKRVGEPCIEIIYEVYAWPPS